VGYWQVEDLSSGGSYATPLPDGQLGGTEDIVDAIGRTAGGLALFKFRRWGTQPAAARGDGAQQRPPAPLCRLATPFWRPEPSHHLAQRMTQTNISSLFTSWTSMFVRFGLTTADILTAC
jgi:hypothetical protein